MRTRLPFLLLLSLTAAGCVHTRRLPPVRPLGAEAHFVRVCEGVETKGVRSLRSQSQAFRALSAIQPQGRICFVCQRLRRCATEDRRMQTAREMTAARFPTDPERPPPGGPQLWEVAEYACAVCADQPYRIRDTSMRADRPR